MPKHARMVKLVIGSRLSDGFGSVEKKKDQRTLNQADPVAKYLRI